MAAPRARRPLCRSAPHQRRTAARRGGRDVEDPAGRHPLGAAAQVAPGDAEHLVAGAGQGGQQLAVLALDPSARKGSSPALRGPLVVGQERVVADRGREGCPRPGRAPPRGRGRARSPSRPSPPARRRRSGPPGRGRPPAPRSRVRVNTSRLTGPSTASRAPRRSRASSTRSAALRSVARPAAPAGPRRRAGRCEPALGPRRRARSTSGARAAAAARSSISAEDEGPQPPGPLGLLARPVGPPVGHVVVGLGGGGPLLELVGELGQELVPVGAAGHHGGLAGEPLPRRGGRPAARRGGSGPAASQANTSWRRKPPAGRASSSRRVRPATRAARGTTAAPLVGIAGGPELLVGQAGVGLGAGVEHGDAVEAGAGPDGVDHGPHGGPHLVVGVGGGDAPRCARRSREWGRRCGPAPAGSPPSRATEVRPPRRRRRAMPAQSGHDGGGQVLGQRRQEPGAVLGERAGAGGPRGRPGRRRRADPARVAAASSRSSSSDQLRLEAGPGRPVQAHHLGGPGAGGGEGVEGARGEVAQLSVGGHQGGLGGRVLGDRGEQPGAGGQLGPHRRGQHRRGHRAPSGGRQHAGAQELGQPVGGEEGDRRQPDARARPPARGPPRPAAGGRPRRRGWTAPPP